MAVVRRTIGKSPSSVKHKYEVERQHWLRTDGPTRTKHQELNGNRRKRQAGIGAREKYCRKINKSVQLYQKLAGTDPLRRGETVAAIMNRQLGVRSSAMEAASQSRRTRSRSDGTMPWLGDLALNFRQKCSNVSTPHQIYLLGKSLAHGRIRNIGSHKMGQNESNKISCFQLSSTLF